MSYIKITEQPSLYNDLEKMSPLEILTCINREDHKVADAVQEVIPAIEKLVVGATERMKQGGRLFYMGSGMNYVIPTADGNLTLSEDVLSDKSFAVIDRFNDLYHNSNDGFFIKTASATLYAEGNSLFYNVSGQHLAQQFRNSEINYSILPAPKFDESQENYRTPVAFTHTMYCIPIDAKNTSKSGAVLECMASEAYRTVTPALFETAFKYQYSKNPYDAELFEVIRDNVVFDIGRPFFDSLGGDSSSPIRVWRMQIENGLNSLASAGKVQLRAWNKSLTALSEELKITN